MRDFSPLSENYSTCNQETSAYKGLLSHLPNHNPQYYRPAMRLLIILTLLLPALTLDYEQVLQSPTALRRLFSAFASKLDQDYSPSEAPLRMRLFRDGLRRIVRINKVYEGVWTAEVNKFTVMTGPEKQRYLGLNMTRVTANRPRLMKEQRVEEVSYPLSRSFDWRAMGRVTGVKNQVR